MLLLAFTLLLVLHPFALLLSSQLGERSALSLSVAVLLSPFDGLIVVDESLGVLSAP